LCEPGFADDCRTPLCDRIGLLPGCARQNS